MTTGKRDWGYGLPDQGQAPATLSAPPSSPPRHLRGDVTGGLIAALLTIPVSIGYGLLALSPLGESAIPHAILAGLYAPVFGCIVAVLLGANTTMIYSSRSVTTFLIGSFVLHDLARSSTQYVATAELTVLLTLAFLLILLTGFFQALFGLLKLGTLLKYIPAPVIAGFQNAAAPPGTRFPWSRAEEVLASARNYWIGTSGPDGRPHAAPVWAVWLNGLLYFSTGRESRKGRNIAANPAVAVHIEGKAGEVVIL